MVEQAVRVSYFRAHKWVLLDRRESLALGRDPDWKILERTRLSLANWVTLSLRARQGGAWNTVPHSVIRP